MNIAFEELSLRHGGTGYGFFSGRAELDYFGEPISIELEGNALGSPSWRLDIAELARERIALRRKFGSNFLDHEGAAVKEHMKKWALFISFADSIKMQFREEPIPTDCQQSETNCYQCPKERLIIRKNA